MDRTLELEEQFRQQDTALESRVPESLDDMTANSRGCAPQ